MMGHMKMGCCVVLGSTTIRLRGVLVRNLWKIRTDSGLTVQHARVQRQMGSAAPINACAALDGL